MKTWFYLALVGLAEAAALLSAHGAEAQPPESEGTIAAREVRPGAVVFRYKAPGAIALTGLYVRLANCVGPEKQPVVAALRVRGGLRPERISLPVYGSPLNQYTRQGGRVFPPLDVAQEYRVALNEPAPLADGDQAAVEIVSAGPMQSGMTAGLQFQGRWSLVRMREPFRQTKAAGPVCRIAWSDREVICTGNQRQFDPQCAAEQFHRCGRRGRDALAVHRVLLGG